MEEKPSKNRFIDLVSKVNRLQAVASTERVFQGFVVSGKGTAEEVRHLHMET